MRNRINRKENDQIKRRQQCVSEGIGLSKNGVISESDEPQR